MRAMNYASMPPKPRSSLGSVLIALGVVGAIVLGSGLWLLKSWATARSDLIAEGYTSPKVTFQGPFTFGFTGIKGTSSCSGTMTRYPGSSSRQETCFEATPTVPPPPPLTNRQQVESSLQKNYSSYGFTTFTCPEIADADTKATCKVASEDTSVTVSVERTGLDTDGTWAKWTSKFDSFVGRGPELSADLTKSLSEKTKSKHPSGVDVECGKGAVVFTDGKASCKFTTRDKKPMTGVVNLTANKDGGYKWSAQL